MGLGGGQAFDLVGGEEFVGGADDMFYRGVEGGAVDEALQSALVVASGPVVHDLIGLYFYLQPFCHNRIPSTYAIDHNQHTESSISHPITRPPSPLPPSRASWDPSPATARSPPLPPTVHSLPLPPVASAASPSFSAVSAVLSFSAA